MVWRLLFVSAALAALAHAYLNSSPERVIRERLFVFGSVAELELRDVDPVTATAAITMVSGRWRQFHRDWHPWEDGALMQLNAALDAGQISQPLPPSLLDLIELGHRFEIESEGLLNPASGSLIKLWGFHSSDYPVRTPPPSTTVLQQTIDRRPSMQDVSVVDGRAASNNPAVQLDFSAMAEGLALADANRILRAHGVEHALLTMGGDVIALGTRGRRPWRVAIRHPAGGVLGEIDIYDGEALFSSGTYQRFREDQHGRQPHLIDPRNGHPTDGVLASAVLHRDPVRADATATALVIAGVDGFAQLVRNMRAPCALILDRKGTLHATPTMIERLRLPQDAASPQVIGEARACDALKQTSLGHLGENGRKPRAQR